MSRLWDKGDPLDRDVLEFTAGEDHQLDNRLVSYDARASIAHAEMLAASGLLDETHLQQIRDGLNELAAEHEAGGWRVSLEEEDVHTALETRLSGRSPEAGPRLHLGRSRNDQVLAALRLYLKDVCGSAPRRRRGGRDRIGRIVGTRAGYAAAGLYPSAAGHAEFGAAVGRRLCRRAAR